ncbi:hypothetical protein GCM10020370_32620 [Paenibacillus hodogayensis]
MGLLIEPWLLLELPLELFLGETGLDGEEAGLDPTPFVATTVNVYSVPFVNPVTVTGLAVVLVPVNPPGLDVTV